MSFPIGPNEAERLKTLLETGALEATADPVLDRICEEARQYFDVPICTLTLLDKATQRIKVAQGLEAGETPRDAAFCNYTILSDEVFIVEDALVDDRFKDNPFVTAPPLVRFYAGAPLIFLKNIRLGALCLIDTKPRSFSRGDKAELQLYADRAVRQIATSEFEKSR
ncbi:MAG: bifunctional diguanylate cyclase/phosphodiesterase [Microvirga sp.]|jgi:GAF domain-containing protein|nr:bifunctional diguanylate cyclase/phosphodiesterase [Microvirga sp.]MDF2687787.1 bifunctional diguanylate cyclase/phosphodiesterase [Microvirga sp.]MDF2970454.1 bifunctional diguanylate cyclase/phosphodiesterase [Microvirga sp.]